MNDTVSITQSDTILRYIGRKYDLMGDYHDNDNNQYVIDLVLDELKDIENNELGYLCYFSGNDAIKNWLKETCFPIKLKQLNRLLMKYIDSNNNKSFVGGTKVSIADIRLFTFLLKIVDIQTDLYNNNNEIDHDLLYNDYPTLQPFFQQMKSIPSIQQYMSSSNYLSRPMNNPHAKSVFSFPK